MKMQKKFQNKKLNSKDHKDIEQAADGVKKGLLAVGVLGTIGVFIKKNGVEGLKKIPSIAATIIFRK